MHAFPRMNRNIDRIKAELESLGYETSMVDSPHGKAVSFPYTVEVGSRKGERVTLAVSMNGEEQYPEYPPHWIHLSPPVSDGKGGAVERYSADGLEWVAMSRPPGNIWDRLPTKHMSAYMSEHLRRFWNNI